MWELRIGGGGVKDIICLRIGPVGGGRGEREKVRLMVGSHLHSTKWIVLGWVGGTEMWELRIRLQ